jgi:peptide/nickel transport system substrate-binding protein
VVSSIRKNGDIVERRSPDGFKRPRVLTLVVLALGLAAASLFASLRGAEAAPNGSLRIAYGFEPPNLDVQWYTAALGSMVTGNVYEGLTKLNDQGQIEPLLAVKWNHYLEKRWRFTLRSGAHYQDGELFTPSAAVFSINRALNPKSENLSEFGFIKSAKVVGAHTIDVITTAPDPNVPRELTFLMMVAPKYVAQNASAYTTSRAVGTGPYLMTGWSKGQSMSFSANKSYWGGQPKFKSVSLKLISDPGVRVQSLRAGEVDFATDMSTDLTSQLPQTFTAVSNEVCMIRLDTIDGPFAKVTARQAANYAINRPEIVQALFGKFGTLPHAQLVSRASFGYNPTLTDYAYDVNRAKSLLAQSGYTGQPITVVGEVGRWPSDRDLELAAISDLQKAGFSIQLSTPDTQTWVNAIFSKPRADAVFYCPSDDTLLGVQTLQEIATPTGAQSTYRNQSIAVQLNKAERTFDDASRAKQLQQIWGELKAEAPYIPLVAINHIWGAGKNVSWTPRLDGMIYFDSFKLS